MARVRGDEERSVSVRRLAGAAHWHPSDLTGEAAEGLALTVTYTLPIAPPDEDDRVNSSACYGFIADVCVVEIDPETAEVAVRSYVTVHDAGRLLNPLLADGQIRGGLAHGLGAALLEEHRYDEDGNLMTGDVPRLPAAHGDRAAARRLGAPGVALAAHAAGREGPRRGQHDERAGRDRQRRRRRARRRPRSSCPATPQRIWELL